MRSFGASKWEEYRKLILPSSLPAIFAGLKVAITLALIGAIVAEFVGATEGMGVLIKTFNFQLQIAEGFAVILALVDHRADPLRHHRVSGKEDRLLAWSLSERGRSDEQSRRAGEPGREGSLVGRPSRHPQ